MALDPSDVADARIGELMVLRSHLQRLHDGYALSERGHEGYAKAFPLTHAARIWLLVQLDLLVAEQQAQRKRLEYGFEDSEEVLASHMQEQAAFVRAGLAPPTPRPTRPSPVNLRSRAGWFSRVWSELAEWSSCR